MTPFQYTNLSAADSCGNVGSYVDARDVARMVETTLAANHGDHGAFHRVDGENYFGGPTAKFLEMKDGGLPKETALKRAQSGALEPESGESTRLDANTPTVATGRQCTLDRTPTM